MVSQTVRNFGRVADAVSIPDLVAIQKVSYDRFLQPDSPPDKRKNIGLEAQFREIFPVDSYDGSMRLEYVCYELEKPRYTPTQCRQLRLTYGYPLKVTCRLKSSDGKDISEQAVYLGEVPIMIGGGEFIIHGAERVIVSQLHRSPGVDFLIDSKEGDRILHGGRIIPERGSWIELTVTKKDTLVVKIDQSSKIPATIFLRALSADFSSTEKIIRLFYQTKMVPKGKLKANMWSVGDIVDTSTGEIVVKAGTMIGDRFSVINASKLKEVEVAEEVKDAIILNTLAEDDCRGHEQAMLKFYMRLRPGNPPNPEKAKIFFDEKFFDTNRYRLGAVGRFRINRKFEQNIDTNEMVLRPEDFLNAMRYIVKLRNYQGELDDIDHLGNRRVRTIDELAGDEFRKGLLTLRKTVQERMSMKKDDQQQIRVADLINSKAIASSINYFFGRGELSQIVDQTNSLSQLTHERRLSALGPGGLNRRRAGFEVRDVHISHYGRICPIETPEGTNIGLISSLAIFATIDEYGFLLTPYRKVVKGKVTDEICCLRADEDMKAVIGTPGIVDPKTGKIREGMVLAMKGGELAQVLSDQVNYVDISTKQIVGISAALIPFLEHDDANRALMGSNMQRQAVPLLKSEPPLVCTGMEQVAGQNSSMVVKAREKGTVTAVDAQKIVINGADEYILDKFVGLNERTCLNQVPVVALGDKVKKGQVIADGGGTSNGVLSLGKNVLVGFVSFDGFNFEDAIVISEKLVKNDSFTSIHIDEFTAEIRETRLGREEFTNDIPNVSEKALRNLDEYGVIREGTRVIQGDILVGKVVPKSKTELTPEEKLLHAIFGRAGEDVKNDSLEVPSGNEGVVIRTERFVRRGHGGEEEKKLLRTQIKQREEEYKTKQCTVFRQMIETIQSKSDVKIIDPSTRQKVGASEDNDVIYEQIENFSIKWVKPASTREEVQKIVDKFWATIKELQEEEELRIQTLKHGDELPSGVLEMVKVYVATKRTLSIGDKMAGRHGNKGVIAKIMPVEDMPFLEDGTPLDILLNPLGVPSRMNVGQILETHLGWAAKVLGFQAFSPVFDGATEDDIHQVTEEANKYMEKRGKELLPTSYILQSISSVDEFFDETQVGYVVVDHFKDPEGKDKERLEGFLNLLEGKAILEYPDKEGYKGFEGSKDYMPFFNDKKPKGFSGKEMEPDDFNDEWNDIVAKDDILVKKFIELTTTPVWIRAREVCSKAPTKPGVYIFKINGHVLYVGQAGYRSGKGLRERLCDCHIKNSMPSSFHDHLKEYFSKSQKVTQPSPPASDELFVNIPKTLKTQLYDGRTGEPFDQQATIGYIYMMKLHHLVDDKIHARATGPYSLITQQPLGGKARTGGQRFGEMEVWALEGYGAAYTLQEMLTVKSDDVEGRTKIYESMVKGQNKLEAGTPLSFDVLCNEIRGLGLNIQLEKKKLGAAGI